MGVQIKSATTVSEIITVAELASVIWNEHYVPIIGQAQVDYMLEKYQTTRAIRKQINEEGFEYYLITSAGEPAGYMAIVEKDNELFLSKLYVTNNERGKGLGRIAVDFLTAKCQADGFDYIVLTVNKNNLDTIAAYEKMGFAKYGEVVNDIGSGYVMDDYLMRMAIKKS
jgi:ribosomal protein S18 acetylase RimI-like enzyme